jgi:hypothetical protein
LPAPGESRPAAHVARLGRRAVVRAAVQFDRLIRVGVIDGYHRFFEARLARRLRRAVSIWPRAGGPTRISSICRENAAVLNLVDADLLLNHGVDEAFLRRQGPLCRAAWP